MDDQGKSLNQQQLYKKYRNLYHRLIRKAKVKYYRALLYKFKGDVSKTWRVLKSVIGKMSNKSGISDCFSVNNTKVTNTKYISEGFCSYFTNVGRDLASQISNPKKPYTTYLKHRNTNSILGVTIYYAYF